MNSNDTPMHESPPEVPTGDDPTAETAAKPPRRRRAPKAPEGEVVQAPSEAAASEPPAPPAEASTAEAPTMASEGEGPTDAEEGAGGGRRSRNRRRGRGKDRADRPAGDAEAGAPADPRPAPLAVDPVLTEERFAEVLSGAYDAEPPEPDDEASVEQISKRVLRPEPEAPKLHKVLAQSGIGSRRDMEQAIADGKITVNDEVAHVGMRISYGDRVAIDGKPVKLRIQGGPARLLAYHKPVGEVVSFNDPEGRPTVFRRLPRLQHGKWQSVGRLDINTEGLLLFTTSGELANQLMHPRFGVEREYAVRVLGSLDDEQRQRLLDGVEIDGQTAGFQRIEDGGGEGANRWYRVVITEGRNREVRKLFDKVGLAVSRLIRIRYGTVVLPRGLKRGVWVELDDQDLRTIRQLASGGRGQPTEAREARPANREQRRDGRGGGKPGRGPQQSGPRQNDRQNDRPPRREREPRPMDAEPRADGEPGDDIGPIPNPLEQTFDRRFAKGPKRRGGQGFGHGTPPPDLDGEGPPGSIPNPLEQTFDRRFVKGSQRITAGFGRHDAHESGQGAAPKKGGPKQPDPMQTSVGYIGADAYFNKAGGKRGGGRSGGGGGGGGGRGRGR
ncbi:pseudouridine synthase [uncultured Methylibium sp.]|uniref:pseudouridine synthase n=1 Tax=uncultured Methylibium sp. TaxID=381093 RepID=UPI0025F68946|nr:pseudouridine synthase [uncultured Methylibium sp.]